MVIENNRPGGLAKYGLDYAGLSKENPQIIYASISGFGQDGPYRNHPAYDMIAQALSGGMSLTGEPDGRPVRAGIPIGDIAAGLYATIGILSALEQRRVTGKGQYIDVAMLDCQVAMLSYQAAYFLQSGKVPKPQGRGHDSIPSYRSFTAGDGLDVVICANTDRMWVSLCDALGLAELRDDPALQSRQSRFEQRDRIWEALEAAFRTKTADQWVVALRAAEVPVAVVNTLDRALADPQVLHRNMVLDIAGPDGLHVKVAGNPLKMPGIERTDHTFPPQLGADTRTILREKLGMSAEDIERLLATGAVGEPGKKA